MKITFQNVRSINDEKTKVLAEKLDSHDLICLSELNKCYDFNKINVNDLYQYHTDLNTERIGIIACNTLKLNPIADSINLTQERVQKDKSVIQTNLYKIDINNRSIYILKTYTVFRMHPRTTLKN